MAGPRMRAARGRLRAVARPARRTALRAALLTLLLLPLLAAPAAVSPLPLVRPATALAEEDPSDPPVSVRVRAAEDGNDSAAPVNGRQAPAALPPAEPEPPAPTAGELIVATALAYVGYPYVSGGNTPGGFDCSGFTQYVVLVALGIDIGHGLPGQTAAGWWVDWGTWQPGDLVFFQNTYRAGISHAGIYVGDGLFVHAENEGTGVVVSSMYSDYYGTRYWGAVRVG